MHYKTISIQPKLQNLSVSATNSNLPDTCKTELIHSVSIILPGKFTNKV